MQIFANAFKCPFTYLQKSYVPLSVNPHVLQVSECLYR